MLFDLNTYCEDFIQPELFKPGTRKDYAWANIGNLDHTSSFYKRQSNNLVASVMKLLRDTKGFAHTMGITREQVLDLVLPGKRDIPVSYMQDALQSVKGMGSVTAEKASGALDDFEAYMRKITTLAHDCT